MVFLVLLNVGVNWIILLNDVLAVANRNASFNVMFCANGCLDVTHSALCHDKWKAERLVTRVSVCCRNLLLLFWLQVVVVVPIVNSFPPHPAEKRRTVHRSDRLGLLLTFFRARNWKSFLIVICPRSTGSFLWMVTCCNVPFFVEDRDWLTSGKRTHSTDNPFKSSSVRCSTVDSSYFILRRRMRGIPEAT